MAAMETQQADDLTDDGDVADHRARAKAELAKIAQQAKRVLQEGGIDLDLFFMIPSSGNSIITFGTSGDPPDDLWEQVRQIVSEIVRRSIGLDRTRCREVVCATTHDQTKTDIGSTMGEMIAC